MIKPSSSPVLRCLITDDEPIAIRGIINYINQLDFLTVTATCPSAPEAAKILKNEDIDLMFLDINMPHLSGLEFLESLETAPMTIFTTAYSEYALEGYRLNVIDYLLKPIAFNRFFQAVTKAQNIFGSRIVSPPGQTETDSVFYVRQDDTFQKIESENILYAESMQNYLKLHFKDTTIVIHQTMSSLEEMLPKDLFFRIHRSFLINLSHIDRVSKNRLFIHGKELPISSAKKEEFLNHVVYKKLLSK